ncbi:MAG: hypothetical protein A2908_00285 [Candidatus Staskawiczbacteria bacterium RIFCSPLOWO2_01_FULL_38_12b]|uniref:Uncharacterized protein n=1 Tax=Candidatus Staskawiczbacteria bacterium RIFCSPLOWO2_01_FULL_38_12b TaxID=1802214 RepID=A0A1G2IDG2_9BACT|nr:MAG: hypothetical protein A2908_00285 [Candidatus Staskawiczbacteria bacterium RIFCSPLOWO2_01_FULL_38_12b]
MREKRNFESFYQREGCFALFPPIELRCKNNLGIIAKGEVVSAIAVDENGMYPNTVYLREKHRWFSLEYFDFIN